MSSKKAISTDTQYIIVVEGFKDSLLESLYKLRQDFTEYRRATFLLLSTRPEQVTASDDVVVEATDFSDASLGQIMRKYEQHVVGVLCRGDKYVQYLRKLLPYLPPSLPVATESALEAATNKRIMRTMFRDKYPEITPAFVQVKDAGRQTIEGIVGALRFPVILKPASLASSILIQKCGNETELEEALKKAFALLDDIYQAEGRSEPPEIIVEEFLVGKFFSIDAYVSKSGQVFYTPIVEYLPAESMGVDDFFLYKRWLPVNLPLEEVSSAEAVTAKAIDAVGLRATSVHVELVRTDRGWRVIEIGPRIGRFRNLMYNAAAGIDHGYNDLLLHIGVDPIIQSNRRGYVAAYSIYPTEEGVLETIEGVDGLEKFKDIIIYKVISSHMQGKQVKYAKNGGHALAEVIFASDNKEDFDMACQWFEANVKAATS